VARVPHRLPALLRRAQARVAPALARAGQPVDVLVIGAGAAGLAGALAARRAGASVMVLSRSPPEASHSTRALGGMNGVWGEEADWREHARDTILAGDYLADQDAVELMCATATDAIGALLAEGLPMRRELLGRTGHWPYTLPDITGRSIVQTLARSLREDRQVRFCSGARALELLVEDGLAVGVRCAGITPRTNAEAGTSTYAGAGHSTDAGPGPSTEAEASAGAVTGPTTDLRARSVLLASGGYAYLYSPTVASPEAVGDGVSLAYRAGAELMDMEFVQYHPTVLLGTSTLVSERARGAGARLFNALGERFMERYAPAALELAPRDIVSRAIQAEVAAGRALAGGGVRLDFRDVPPERWEQLAFVREGVWEATKTDVRRQSVLVAPAVHYTMGGVRTDTDGRTSLPGLWAAGEVACVSVHGANRLGGNSLLEATVFGLRAGASAARAALEQAPPGSPTTTPGLPPPGPDRAEDPAHHRSGSPAPRSSPAGANEFEHTALQDLPRLMHRHAGLLRDHASIATGLSELARLRERLPGSRQIELAETVLSCALARTESRGAHFREDHPERDDERWLLHSVVRRDPLSRGPIVSRRPVLMSRMPAATRSY
jgi:succinate dehydrogenase / fumarate reductase flavoprotein subunit